VAWTQTVNLATDDPEKQATVADLALCHEVALRRLVSSPKAQFRWRNPETNPYIVRAETRNTITSRYHDIAMAMGHA
jgi:hypothetical protein